MRTRTRNIARTTSVVPAQTLVVSHVRCDGVSAPNTNYSRGAVTEITDGRWESITDDLGKGISHACKHRTFDRTLSTDQSSGSYANIVSGAHAVSSYSAPCFWLEYWPALKTSTDWSVASSDLPPNWTMSGLPDETTVRNNLLSRARQLKADVLLNLVEANQVWPAINSLARALPSMALHWWELRKVLRTASAAFLAWKFGISPILSDIMSVNRHLPKISQDLQRHVDGSKNRFSQVFPVTMTHASGIYNTLDQNGRRVLNFTRQGRYIGNAEVRYVLVVEPHARYMTSFFQKADYAMRRFATSPASLAWELVPFSFVVDWFVDLRSALNKLDGLLGSQPYQVTSFTRSIRYHVGVDHFIDTFSPCTGSSLMSYKSASAEYKHYDRSLVSGGNLVTWNPRFGKNQAAISAALITQALLKIPGAMRF